MARPRDPGVDTRILQATRRLLERYGAESLTMEAIAHEANVGKPTIYRRFASKDEIVMSLNISDSLPAGEIDTGTFEGDILELGAVLIDSLKRMPRSVAGPQIGMAIADQVAGRKFLENMAHPTMPMMTRMWERGVERGEVDPDLDFLTAKIGLGTSLIFAILLYRVDPDSEGVEQLVRTWVRGVRPVQ